MDSQMQVLFNKIVSGTATTADYQEYSRLEGVNAAQQEAKKKIFIITGSLATISILMYFFMKK